MDLQNTDADADAQYIPVGQACETDRALSIRPLLKNAETGTLPTFEQVIASIASPQEYAVDPGKKNLVLDYCARLELGEIKATGRLAPGGKRQMIDEMEWPGETGLAAQLLNLAKYAMFAVGEPAYYDVRIMQTTNDQEAQPAADPPVTVGAPAKTSDHHHDLIRSGAECEAFWKVFLSLCRSRGVKPDKKNTVKHAKACRVGLTFDFVATHRRENQEYWSTPNREGKNYSHEDFEDELQRVWTAEQKKRRKII